MPSPIVLFSDFGSADIYVGQVKAVLNAQAPQAPVIDLLHEAPAFNPRAAAHLLAALAGAFPTGTVFFAVVDPGVGGERPPVAMQAGGKWYVGPDNGLLSVVAARASDASLYRIVWRPAHLSNTFHGRDLFAPVVAALATGELSGTWLEPLPQLEVNHGTEDLAEVIYVDHYGNALTGLRAGSVSRASLLHVDAGDIAYARAYSEVGKGAAFWHENSVGLLEIAVNSASAAQALNLSLGSRVTVLGSASQQTKKTLGE